MNTAVNTEDISYKFIKDSSNKIETPFENDFWGREALADRLTDHVSRITVGATIAIDAEWGAGKSWFVNNWKAKLEKNDFKVIYLNAFNQDYIEDPFLTISMEIANALQADQATLDKIKSTIGDAYRAILPNLPMLIFQVAMGLIGAGKLAGELVDTFKDLQEDSGEFGEKAAELLNEKLKEHLSAQVENYENEKKSLDYFKAQLAEITSKLDKPLVFIVDELDRCKPEFAIRLIERIKHFFDIPKVVFILAVNKNQLEESINNFYGFSSTANYLEKFIDFSVLLKNGDLNDGRYLKILESYNQDYQLNLHESEIYTYTHLCKIYIPNPRQLIKIINKFSLLKGDLEIQGKSLLFLFLIYSELRILTSYNESNFIDHFYKKNEALYKEYFMDTSNFEEDKRPIETKFINFLSAVIYRFDKYRSPFEQFFHYINDVITNEQAYGSKSGKYSYYPTSDKSNDLIDEWYKYVHMIEG
ncbi:MAG: P-loop NTPase fold protein [Acinetobacter sp.]